jgi:hypothetical protein
MMWTGALTESARRKARFTRYWNNGKQLIEREDDRFIIENVVTVLWIPA